MVYIAIISIIILTIGLMMISLPMIISFVLDDWNLLDRYGKIVDIGFIVAPLSFCWFVVLPLYLLRLSIKIFRKYVNAAT